jgi:metal-responsive CopG/Arc/MetJ family transcriptional regulator
MHARQTMQRVTLYISKPQYDQFQQLAEAAGRSYSELIRDALDQYLAEKTEQKAVKKRAARKPRT